jgi:hypothetical protein
MRKILRDYTMKWWQITFFKIYLVTGGLIIGAYLQEIVLGHMLELGALFGILLIYFLYAMVTRQI